MGMGASVHETAAARTAMRIEQRTDRETIFFIRVF